MKVEMKVKVSYPPFFREYLEFPQGITTGDEALTLIALLTLSSAAIYSDLQSAAQWNDGHWNGKIIPFGGTLAIYRSPERQYYVRLPFAGRREPWPAFEVELLPIEIYLGAELPEPADQAAITAVSDRLSRAIDYIYDPQRTVEAKEEILRFRWPADYSDEYSLQKRLYSNGTVGGAVAVSFGMYGERDVAFCDFPDQAQLDSWAASMTSGPVVMDFFNVERVQKEPWWEVRFRSNGGPYY